MKTIHPAIAEHVMEENEKLRGLLREAQPYVTSRAVGPMETNYLLQRIRAALSQQAEPTCSDERPCVSCFSDDGACLAEPAPEQDELAIDTAPLLHFIFSEYSSPEMAGRLPDDVVRVVRALEAGARPAQTEQQPIRLPERMDVPGHDEWADQWPNAWNAALDEVTRLNAAPIAQTAPQPEQSGLPREVIEAYRAMDAIPRSASNFDTPEIARAKDRLVDALRSALSAQGASK